MLLQCSVESAILRPRRAAAGLPGPGLVGTFPRFGVHSASPLPVVPPEPAIEVRGAVTTPSSSR